MIGGRFLILIDIDDDFSALTTVAKITGKLSNKLRKDFPNYNSATLEVSLLRSHPKEKESKETQLCISV